MKRLLAMVGLSAAMIVPLAAPASAGHGGIHPTFQQGGYWFHCAGGDTNKVQNADAPSPFDATAPSRSVQAGAGCGVVDPGAMTGGSPATDASFVGAITGNVRNLTVELFVLGHTNYSILQGTVVRVTLIVDGKSYFDDVVWPLSWEPGSSEAARKLAFTITDLGWTRDVLDEAGNVVDVDYGGLVSDDGDGTTAHDVQLTIGLYYLDEVAIWAYDATEFPSGLTVNDTTPATRKVSAGQLPPTQEVPKEVLIARGGNPGNGWVALTFSSDGSPVTAEVLGYFRKLRPAVFGANLYRGDGSFGGGVTVSFGDLGSLGTKVLVDANAGGYNVHHEVVDEFDSNSYGGQGITLSTTGVMTILLVASADVGHWSWTFKGTKGVNLLAVATGERAIRAYDREFRGTANAQAWAVAGTHAAVDVSHAFDVAETWVGGYFATPLAPGNVMTMTTPGGDTECPCSFPHFLGSGRAGGGSYTAHLTGAGPSNAFVWGADAHLPEPDTLLALTDGTPTAVPAGGTIPLVASLRASDGSAIPDAEVTFTLAGPNEPVMTGSTSDEKGIVRASIGAPSQVGFYRVTASYPGREDGPDPASSSYMVEITA